MTFTKSGGAAFTSKKDTWTTPPDFYENLNRQFGFVLDAAAVAETALCGEWYGPDHPNLSKRDALACNWFMDSSGKPIWLNPPYGRNIGKWMQKAHQESQKGCLVVCLVPARTDTNWWHEYCMPHEIRFIRGRLKFGSSTNAAPFPSALVVMRRAES